MTATARPCAWIVGLLLGSATALGCDNPALHFDLARFQAEAGGQGARPFGLRCELDDRLRQGEPARLRMRFGASDGVPAGRLFLSASHGLEFADFIGRARVPANGIVEIDVIPTQGGPQYLRLQTLVRGDDGERSRVDLLVLPPADDPTPNGRDATYGFAGRRLRDALTAAEVPPAHSVQCQHTVQPSVAAGG